LAGINGNEPSKAAAPGGKPMIFGGSTVAPSGDAKTNNLLGGGGVPKLAGGGLFGAKTGAEPAKAGGMFGGGGGFGAFTNKDGASPTAGNAF
tara:strand:- start:9 stop:284 length:276 start_codon:yes stop_codon:yes gene_type:complete